MVPVVAWWLLACGGGTTPAEDGDPAGEECPCAEPTVPPETDPPAEEFGGWPAPSVEILIPGTIAIGPTVILDVRVYDLVFVGAPIGDETLDGTETGRPDTGRRDMPRSLLLTPLFPVLGLSLDAMVDAAEAHQPQDRPAGYVKVRLDGVVVAEEPATRFRLENLAVGQHLVEAEVVWSDGDPFLPPVIASQSFEVQ